MLIHITNANILTPDGWIPCGTISFCDGRITAITRECISTQNNNVIDAQGHYIIPGGIDIHVHGGGGHDFLECSEEAFRTAAATHLRHGTQPYTPPWPWRLSRPIGKP